jgi:hypothetical protein
LQGLFLESIQDIPDFLVVAFVANKQAVLEKFCASLPVPALEDVMGDVHAERAFRVKDFVIIRGGGMNVLATPSYLESGGPLSRSAAETPFITPWIRI